MIKEESVNVYTSKKIIDINIAKRRITEIKENNKTVGLCHGGFDLLHPGHIKHFESAKKLCDVLFVSITSDRFVSSRKGAGRPIFPDKLRAYNAACIEFVDYVVISDFESGVDVIIRLRPSFYIKGPDFINKTTPGITAEREAIKSVGGEMRYTSDPTLSTTNIIKYIKEEVDRDRILVVLDRDGTLIEDVDFLGRHENWKEEMIIKKDVVDFLIYLKTKYDASFIVLTNQAGVARGYFDCKRVEEINSYINLLLKKKGINILDWQYCPDVDSRYAELKKKEIKFNPSFVKEITQRKPSPDMLFDSLKKLNKNISEFTKIFMLGDREEDSQLAEGIKAKYIDVKRKDYQGLKNELDCSFV